LDWFGVLAASFKPESLRTPFNQVCSAVFQGLPVGATPFFYKISLRGVAALFRTLTRFPQHPAENSQNRILSPPEIELHNALARENQGRAEFGIGAFQVRHGDSIGGCARQPLGPCFRAVPLPVRLYFDEPEAIRVRSSDA
jgi:hypothetical protein